jgi:hypothetical protein
VKKTTILKRKCTTITKTQINTLRRFSVCTGFACSWAVLSNATCRLWFTQVDRNKAVWLLEVSQHTYNRVSSTPARSVATTSSIRSLRIPQKLHGQICPRWMFAEHLRVGFVYKNRRGAQHRPYSWTLFERYKNVRLLKRRFGYTFCMLTHWRRGHLKCLNARSRGF